MKRPIGPFQKRKAESAGRARRKEARIILLRPTRSARYPPISPPKAPQAMNTVMEPPAAIRENPRSFWPMGRKVNRLRTVVTLNTTRDNKTLHPNTRRFKEDSILIFEGE